MSELTETKRAKGYKPAVLYLADMSVQEPLVVSQVIRYLKTLRPDLSGCHLVTFERERLTKLKQHSINSDLQNAGITWHPLSASKRLRAANTWFEMWRGFQAGRKIVREHQIDIVHARSFVAGQIGLRLKRQLGARLLYDMRGFWSAEKFAKGTIKWSWMRRFAQSMEDRLYHGADRLVSLTNSGKRELQERGVIVPIDVIPCCVDTDLFQRDERSFNCNVSNLIYAGSFGPGYMLDGVLEFFRESKKVWPDIRLTMLTSIAQEKIHLRATKIGCPNDEITILSVRPAEVPKYLASSLAGICLMDPSYATIASCPTKLAEYLSCGIPVIANSGIGDVEEVVTRNRVGVVVRELNAPGYQRAICELRELLSDSRLSHRCRETAVHEFSLVGGCRAYTESYAHLVNSDTAHDRPLRHLKD